MVDSLPDFDEQRWPEIDSFETENDQMEKTNSTATDMITADAKKVGSVQGSETPGTRANRGMGSTKLEGGPLTAAEQVAILDQELRESTRDFDSLILEEEERQRKATRERGSRTVTEKSEIGTLEPDSNTESTFGANAPENNDRSKKTATKPAPPIASARRYPAPIDIPRGNDDDVVARQIREAAMREDDPLVREKLWNEYRRYKGIEVPE